MLDLHREKTTSVTQEYSRRLEETNLQSRGPFGKELGAGSPDRWAATRPSQQMRVILADPASTAFEE